MANKFFTIRFESGAKQMWVRVTPGLADDKGEVPGKWYPIQEMPDCVAAVCVAHAFEEEMTKALVKIRRESYNRGFRDGKGHKRRLRNFCTGWAPHAVGY